MILPLEPFQAPPRGCHGVIGTVEVMGKPLERGKGGRYVGGWIALGAAGPPWARVIPWNGKRPLENQGLVDASI